MKRDFPIKHILGMLFLFTFTGAKYYVKPTGSDAATGLSIANAWQTVTKACTTLVRGDSVDILAGTYDETFQNTNSGRIVFRANPGDSGIVMRPRVASRVRTLDRCCRRVQPMTQIQTLLL